MTSESNNEINNAVSVAWASWQLFRTEVVGKPISAENFRMIRSVYRKIHGALYGLNFNIEHDCCDYEHLLTIRGVSDLERNIKLLIEIIDQFPSKDGKTELATCAEASNIAVTKMKALTQR